jgi:hypothetical protein
VRRAAVGESPRRPQTETRERNGTAGSRAQAPPPTSFGLVLSVAVVLFVAAFSLYTLTLMPSIGFIDAGELVAATTTLGIVHPTGYPLYTIVGHLVTGYLPFGSDPAWRLNLLSAFLGAIAASLAFLLAHRMLVILSSRAADPCRRSPMAPPAEQAVLLASIAAASAGLLAASHTFWLWALQAKAYTLHAAFVAALFLGAMRVATPAAAPPAPAALRGLVFLLGLALTNHTMTVLIVPALVVLIAPALVRARRAGWLGARELATLTAAAGLPLLLYLYLPIRARQQPLMNWGAPTDWSSFLRHVTGWQYRSFLLDTDLPLTAKITGAVGLWARQLHPAIGAPLLAVALAGAVRLSTGARGLFAASVVAAASQVGFAVTFGTTPEIHESYFVPFYLMVMLWIGAGLLSLCDLLRRRVRAATLAPLVLVLPLLAATTNFRRNDHHADYLAPKFIENVYRELGEGALVLTDLWELVSGSFFFQHVRGVRPDLTIVDINLAHYPWYMDYLQRHRPDLFVPVADVARRYRRLQDLFVSGRLDGASARQIQQDYLAVLGGLVRAHLRDGRPVHALFMHLYAKATLTPDEQAIVGPHFYPVGLTVRVVDDPGPYPVRAPAWDLMGITSDPVPKDRVATYISTLYAQALTAIGRTMALGGHETEGGRLIAEASRIRASLDGP